jgi:hypothetical protein
MRSEHGRDIDWAFVAGHRKGGIDFKILLVGTEGALGNYHLSLYKSAKDFMAPRHKHNFEQIRVGIEGRLSYGPHQNIAPGEVVYFPEGAYYGPQDQSLQGDAVGLALQFGGASANGFMSQRELRAGYEALTQLGTFEEGTFKPHAAPGQSTRRRDSFEAIWEHVNGRPLQYPKPRYTAPVHLDPAAFAWRTEDLAPGTTGKALGSFTEAGVRMHQYQLDAGAQFNPAPSPTTRLVYIQSGSGQVDGQPWYAESAFELGPGEGNRWVAQSETTMLSIDLPDIVAQPA